MPAGACTGENEAVKLRDGIKDRSDVKGVRTAVENVNTEIAAAIAAIDAIPQASASTWRTNLARTEARLYH
jgi:enolase